MTDESSAILDSHCHAWRTWPYAQAPDAESRATVELLLYEMDAHWVEQALVVCAAIDENPDNMEYVAAARDRSPDRILLVADLDCTKPSKDLRLSEAQDLGRQPETGKLAGAPAAEDCLAGQTKHLGNLARGQKALTHQRSSVGATSRLRS